jgi:hypothetical protein
MMAIGRAMHQFHDTHGHFPPHAIYSKGGKPLLSWRVALLPFTLDGKRLYDKFKLDEPWNSPHNKNLLREYSYAPGPYRDGKKSVRTFDQVFVGEGTIFEGKNGLSFQTIVDGTSDTLLVVEAANSVPWTKPVDLVYNPKKPLPKLGGQFRNGFLTLFADGSVHFIRRKFDEKQMRLAITRNDGDPVDHYLLT